ncbi:MAG: hypothetical protein ACYTDT_06665 [Planctomycetota bacterium]|jgi:hypothetical protein
MMRLSIIAAFAFGLLLTACSNAANNSAPPENACADVPAGNDACTPTTDNPPPAGPWKFQDTVDKALKWVVDNQKKAGDWGTMESRPRDIYLGNLNSLHVWGNASTALIVMGLLRQPQTAEIDAVIDKALEYLISAPDTPRASGSTFYNVWAHSYMLQALVRSSIDPRFAAKKIRLRKRASHELRYLMGHQALDGGWGYYDFSNRTPRPSGDLSTPFTTAAALVALKEVQLADLKIEAKGETPEAGMRDHNVQIGLAYLKRHRIPNGAYFYSSGHKYYPMSSANQIRGSIGRSQSGDNAMATWDFLLGKDDIKAALDTFFKEHKFLFMGKGRQMPHESWYATAPYYYYFGHYYASRNVLKLDKTDSAAYGEKLATLIKPEQYDDGSFWDYPLYGYTKAYGTGYALNIFANCKEAMERK